MIVIFLISGFLFIGGITAVVTTLVKDAYAEGYRNGVHRGTYAACRQQVDTESFFRAVDAATAKTQFPHRE